jgi:hypothetical protein
VIELPDGKPLEIPPIIKKILAALSIAAIIGSVCFFVLPQLREALILFGENLIIHRELQHNVWHTRLVCWSFASANIFLMFFFFVCLGKNITKYFLLIFLFLIVQLLALMPDEMHYYLATAYLFSYKNGFGSRMFIGTIVDLLSGGRFVSIEFISSFAFSLTIWLIAALSFSLSRVIVKTSCNTKNFVLLLVLLSVSCFTSPSAYFLLLNFGRMDIYILLALLGVLLILEKPKCSFLIPVFCIISIAIHLVVLFFYIPLIVIFLFYKILNSNNKKMWIAVLCLTVFLHCYPRFILYFFRKTH